MKKYLAEELQSIDEAGLYKRERIITTPQTADIKISTGQEVINFCANNYLGLSDHPRLVAAAKAAMDSHGFGMSSVRFICGTQDIHKQLEQAIARYFHTEDTILYAACFDANGGVFEPLFGPEDAIISDALNHASIIDGVRLCKAQRYRYENANMEDLERVLQEAQSARFRIIVTDGVFSMDGNVAPMDKICDLADKYDALVMVDECHSAGVVGPTGRGVAEQFNCYDRIDLHTGTLGKAFGGAIGGFTTGPKEVIDMLRQRSRPYLFSNSIPAISRNYLLSVLQQSFPSPHCNWKPPLPLPLPESKICHSIPLRIYWHTPSFDIPRHQLNLKSNATFDLALPIQSSPRSSLPFFERFPLHSFLIAVLGL